MGVLSVSLPLKTKWTRAKGTAEPEPRWHFQRGRRFRHSAQSHFLCASQRPRDVFLARWVSQQTGDSVQQRLHQKSHTHSLPHLSKACWVAPRLGPGWDWRTRRAAHTHTHTHSRATDTLTRTNTHASLFLPLIYTLWGAARPLVILPNRLLMPFLPGPSEQDAGFHMDMQFHSRW